MVGVKSDSLNPELGSDICAILKQDGARLLMFSKSQAFFL